MKQLLIKIKNDIFINIIDIIEKKIEHLKNKIYSRFLFNNYITIIDTPKIFLFKKYTLKNVNKQLLTKKYFKWLSKLQIILKENFNFIDICYFITPLDI